ncbi:MAG: DNA repair protein RecN [Deltaproteobacteria bacterium]|jgi:DNA repair protein RecN (Recombination protein N)|nr:DNA repair protein RecN [Deltaproteobacteria bacterium]MBT4525352.1 DNA repair protein RecN [Deltaproteobacteria bacterium]
MLRRLLIQNFATIKNQTVDFEEGFTAITGETGAGKSIFIKAIKLILGEKCSKEFIRSGEDNLLVEAEFEFTNHTWIEKILAEIGIDFDSSLVIRRKVSKAGKNANFVNDCSVSLNVLLNLGKYLVDLNGQHSQQSLLQPSSHIDYYDDYLQITSEVEVFSNEYQRYLNIQKQLSDIQNSVADRARESDFLQFQINEIETANLSEDEINELNQEYKVLNNAEKLIATILPVTSWIEGVGSPIEQMSTAIYSIENLIEYDQRLEKITAEMKSGFIVLEEALQELAQYSGIVEANPVRLEEINQRLAQLDQLKRKYGATITEVLAFLELQKEKLANLSSSDENLRQLEKERNKLGRDLLEQAGHLSEIRQKNKAAFENQVLDHLKELGLEKSRFEIAFKSSDPENSNNLSRKGLDQVEFLITTNPGHPLKSLGKIASGGELSRILLSIKSIVRSDQSGQSLIFDEIDTGISGRISETVGIKLNQLGKSKQVICITHSPQVASIAASHHLVKKEMKQKEAVTRIFKLKQKERIQEIAQFLAGNEISSKTLSVAKEMLNNGGK